MRQDAQRRFTILRLRFNAVLTQFDLFRQCSDAAQRERDGRMAVGARRRAGRRSCVAGGLLRRRRRSCATSIAGGRGIRRARTRLPGGGENPVAIIRVPRERMVGSGIASSLIHEVGHQARGAAGPRASLRPCCRGLRGQPPQRRAWSLWERLDLGDRRRFLVGGTRRRGLDAGAHRRGEPAARVRVSAQLDDPHPAPWLRVKLSAAMGDALYPHPQWQRFGAMWEFALSAPPA